MDIEGQELWVLKDLNFEKWAPTYALIEWNVGEDELFSFMESKGYENLGNISDFNSEWVNHYAVSNKIYWVDGETKITCNGCSADGFIQCQYDASNNVIPSSIDSLDLNTRGVHTITKVDGAVYARFTLDLLVFNKF